MSTGSRTCPTCSAPLEAYLHEHVEIDRCPARHGVWLDRGEISQVVRSEQSAREDEERRAAVDEAARDAGRSVVAEAGNPRRPCPVCGEELRLTEYAASGIPIDECHLHGAWLDAGELERIEAYAEGIRRHARPGAASAAAPVRGIDIPAEILATLRAAIAPARPARD